MLNKSGLGLQNTMTSIENKYNSLISEIYELIGAVTGKWLFSTADQIWAVQGERWDGENNRDTTNDAKPKEIVSSQGAFDKILFLSTKHMGTWMIVRGNTVTGIVPAAI